MSVFSDWVMAEVRVHEDRVIRQVVSQICGRNYKARDMKRIGKRVIQGQNYYELLWDNEIVGRIHFDFKDAPKISVSFQPFR